MLTCDLMFVGHVSIDHVENPQGVRVQPGGAALYAAMAAKTLLKDVTLVSAVGKDYKFTDVLNLLDSKHVRTFNMPSTRFNIKYNMRGEAQYLKTDISAGSKITASCIPTKVLAANSIVHLSPMPPTKAAKIFEKIRRNSPKTGISINTWINYIKKSRRNRTTLKNLALKADFFMLNDTEAKALAQTDSISTALRLLKARMLIITLGELGAIINGEDIGIQMIPALNVPLKKVVDTTGAGDTWCGAFLAAYKLTEDLMKSVTIASIISSIKCSGWGLKKLVNLQFRKPDDVIEYVIGLKEGALQKRILDYTKL
ncbi:MAG: carbohydrate kinase family protein [Candidatus Bathyarchaeia archaeon]